MCTLVLVCSLLDISQKRKRFLIVDSHFSLHQHLSTYITEQVNIYLRSPRMRSCHLQHYAEIQLEKFDNGIALISKIIILFSSS